MFFWAKTPKLLLPIQVPLPRWTPEGKIRWEGAAGKGPEPKGGNHYKCVTAHLFRPAQHGNLVVVCIALLHWCYAGAWSKMAGLIDWQHRSWTAERELFFWQVNSKGLLLIPPCCAFESSKFHTLSHILSGALRN